MPEDKDSIELLRLLHPKIRDKAIFAYRRAVRETPVGVHPTITETLRTFKQSDDYYAQGRTKPGPIITNARGGYSPHNYGLAIDFKNVVNGKVPWKVDKNWMIVVNIFKDYGFAWGGDFHSIYDPPHFEMLFGHRVSDLLALYKAGKVDAQGYVIL